jgi:hypothetical protein
MEGNEKKDFTCVKGYTVQVMHSPCGYYIGTVDEEGIPNCRLLVEYWKKSQNAQEQLDNLSFVDRHHAMEIQFCHKGNGCLIERR